MSTLVNTNHTLAFIDRHFFLAVTSSRICTQTELELTQSIQMQCFQRR